MLDSVDTPIRSRNSGSEAPASGAAQARLVHDLFVQMLDEVDYAMLLVDGQGCILHANQVARHELATRRALHMRGARLEALLDWQTELLWRAIDRAFQGERTLLDLGQGDQRLSVALVALGQPVDGACEGVLLICGKREVCQSLTMTFYARSHSLTPAEEQVLRELCSGRNPIQIAYKLGVGLATIRTQLSSVRQKTGTATVRELLEHVVALPPLLPSQWMH
jgi:DNA-binding CsgD family transcriptional regulator